MKGRKEGVKEKRYGGMKRGRETKENGGRKDEGMKGGRMQAGMI